MSRARRAKTGQVLGSWVVPLATLGPLGRRLPAPGTWGSLAGLLYVFLFFRKLSVIEVVGVTTIVGVAAALICGFAEKQLGQRDPGCVVLDEFVAMPLCFLGLAGLLRFWPEWAVFLGGFVLFRLFDIVKPLGIRQLQRLPGGWGVVVDDLVAALFACGALHIIVRLWRW